VGEAGGAELLVGAVEELLGGGMELRSVLDRFAVFGIVGKTCEAVDEAAVDGGGGFAVELLVDDALDERFKGRLGAGEAEGEGAGAGDELAEFWVGGGELAAGELVVVAGWTRAGDGAGHRRDGIAVARECLVERFAGGWAAEVCGWLVPRRGRVG
jgi:hypothetical protein